MTGKIRFWGVQDLAYKTACEVTFSSIERGYSLQVVFFMPNEAFYGACCFLDFVAVKA